MVYSVALDNRYFFLVNPAPEAGGFVTPEQPTGWFYTCRQPETICPCMVLQCFTTPDESSRPPEQHYTKLTDKTVDKCTQYERMASHREAAIRTFVQRLAQSGDFAYFARGKLST
jgi:hypothetical protein